MKTAQILDLGMGNLTSVARFLEELAFDVQVSTDLNAIEAVDLCVLSGVGSFDFAAKKLSESRADDALLRRHAEGNYTLGICLGMQLLSVGSEEGVLPGLGIFPLKFQQLRRPRARW